MDRRLQLSLLYVFNFFAIIIYFLSLIVLPTQLTRGTLLSGASIAFIALIPSFIPLVSKAKTGKILTLVLGGIATIIVLFLGIIYIINKDFIVGMIICLLSSAGGVALIISIKWIRDKQTI